MNGRKAKRLRRAVINLGGDGERVYIRTTQGVRFSFETGASGNSVPIPHLVYTNALHPMTWRAQYRRLKKLHGRERVRWERAMPELRIA